jgi:exosortase
MNNGVEQHPDGLGLPGSYPAQLATAFGLMAMAIALYTPIIYYMVLHWKIDDDYSHGFLIVPLAVYFAWPTFYKLKNAPLEPSWWGLLPLCLGSTTLAIGRLGTELMNMRVSFVLTFIGLIVLLFGKRVFEALAFPLLFLFLMVPLPASLVNIVAFPLQLIAAKVAVNALYLLHIPALLEGNIIHLPETKLFVAQACSGLGSLMSLITLGVIFAYFFQRNLIERVILVASTIPIAVLVNAFRVAMTGVLTFHFGQAAAEGAIHEFQGLITFSLAFIVLLIEAQFISWISAQLRARKKVAAS